MKHIILTIAASLIMASCHGQKSSNNESQQTGKSDQVVITEPSPFNADSAYENVKRQVDFGPRVPNSTAHAKCADMLTSQLKRYGLKVQTQQCDLKAFDGTVLKSTNIIASYNPTAVDRILLFAHWDTRPFADQDPNATNHHKPIDGADDGGSGVGVLLEIARLLQASHLENIGVDIALFDAEDYGIPESEEKGFSGDSEQTWAMGTQYWTRHPHTAGYRPVFGILLDMVGAKNATFYREYYSQQTAGKVVSQIWAIGQKMGYGSYFINENGGAITDDHTFVIKNMSVPCVDIINYKPNNGGFAHYWHTLNDNMSIIDKQTLKAVGATLWGFLQTCNANKLKDFQDYK